MQLTATFYVDTNNYLNVFIRSYGGTEPLRLFSKASPNQGPLAWSAGVGARTILSGLIDLFVMICRVSLAVAHLILVEIGAGPVVHRPERVRSQAVIRRKRTTRCDQAVPNQQVQGPDGR